MNKFEQGKRYETTKKNVLGSDATMCPDAMCANKIMSLVCYIMPQEKEIFKTEYI